MTSHTFVLLRRITITLSLLGLVLAGYLTVLHFVPSSALCTSGCDVVRQSRYAEVAGIPIAAIGVLGYMAILGVLVLEELGNSLAEHGPILIFGLSLIGTLYSLYLTYLEFFVIRAICPYCIASASIMLIIFGIALARMLHTLREQGG